MGSFYPILVSEKLVDTVNFYEDFFGFIPAIEKDGYVMLKGNDNPDLKIAVFDTRHECVSDRVPPVQGLIISLEVKDAKAAYDRLYMEGLELYKDFGHDIHGKPHFVVYDPNGVLVNVHEKTLVPDCLPF